MRTKYCLIWVAGVAALGCHQPTTTTTAPTDASALLAVVRAKFEAAGTPDEKTGYDLRQPNDAAALTAALKTYNAALDEADKVSTITHYGKAFVPAFEMIGEPDATTETPAQKAATARAAFTKTLTKALTSRARLELASAKTQSGMKDFEAAAHIVRLTGQQPGSMLGLLIVVADQMVVLGALRNIPLDTTLAAADLHRLAKVAAGIEDQPDWRPIVAAEIAGMKKLAYAKSKQGAKDLAEWRHVAKILEGSPSLAIADRKLREWVGNGALPTDIDGLKKASTGLVVANVIEVELRGTATARMTAAAFEALAVEDGKGAYPKTLPKTFKTADPFDLNGGPLAYAAANDGFTITATHSRGALRTATAPEVVSFIYPSKAYLQARL